MGEGIGVLIFLVVIGIFSVPVMCIVLIVKMTSLKQNMRENFDRIDFKINGLRNRINEVAVRPEIPKEAKPEPAKEVKPEPKPVVQVVPAAPPSVPAPPEVTEAPKPVVKEEKIHRTAAVLKSIYSHTEPAEEPKPYIPSTPEPSYKPKQWTPPEPAEFEKRAKEILQKIWMWIIVGDDYRKEGVSAEYAVATAWLVRIGIIIILTGIGFFLKLSIERNLISPELRVCLTGMAGIGMIIGGIKMIGKKYNLVGHGIAGGGSVVLYFTVFAAMQMYHLIAFTPAFALMVIITAGVGVLSVRFNSLFMALLGLIGGYFTPIMLNTGVKNLEGLYAYMLLLGAGTLFVARFRDWKLLNFLSFIFTYILYFAALNKFYDSSADFPVAITFLGLYFVLFSAQTIMHNIIRKNHSSAIELVMLFANTTILYVTSFKLITEIYARGNMAIVSLGTAAFFIVQILFFLKRGIKDRNLMIMLTAFATFSVVITFPLVLSGQWITASWAILAVLMLWMSIKIKSNFLRLTAYLVYMLAFFRMFVLDMHGSFYDIGGTYWQALLNRFLSMGMITLSGISGYFLLKRQEGLTGNHQLDPDNDLPLADMNPKGMIRFFFWLSFAMTGIYLQIEFYRFSEYVYLPLRQPLMSAVWTGAILFMLCFYHQTGKQVYQTVMLVLLCALSIKLLLIDSCTWHFNDKFIYAVSNYPQWTFMRVLDFLPLLGVLTFGRLLLINRKDARQLSGIFGFFFMALLFFYLTFETSTFLYNYLPGFRAGGVSILWGIFALFFITRGILKKSKFSRYAGLALFLVTTLKVFFVDLSSLEQLSRIIAFIVLGLVILAGAIIYIRFKDHFDTGNDKEPPEKEEEDE